MSQEKEEVVKKEKVAAPVDVNRLLRDIMTPEAGMLASVGSFLAGVGLLVDDATDFGEIVSDWSPKDMKLPPHPHHWILGVAGMLFGVAGMGFSLLRLLQTNPPPPGTQLPKSLVNGLPPELIERFK